MKVSDLQVLQWFTHTAIKNINYHSLTKSYKIITTSLRLLTTVNINCFRLSTNKNLLLLTVTKCKIFIQRVRRSFNSNPTNWRQYNYVISFSEICKSFLLDIKILIFIMFMWEHYCPKRIWGYIHIYIYIYQLLHDLVLYLYLILQYSYNWYL